MYLSAFSNKDDEIFELVTHPSYQMIKDSIPFGCSTEYPSMMNYERTKYVPADQTEKRLLEIILNMDKFEHGVEVLSNYDHAIMSDPLVSQDVRQQKIQEVQEALARKAVVLGKV